MAPRTFYRYFPAKEDVVFGSSEFLGPARAALAVRRAGETEVELVVRVMTAAHRSRSPEHDAQMFRLVEANPALQARLFRSLWESHEALVEALLDQKPRTPDAELKARAVAQAVTEAMRLGYMDWIRSGQRGSAASHCEKVLEALREAFAAAPRKAPTSRR